MASAGARTPTARHPIVVVTLAIYGTTHGGVPARGWPARYAIGRRPSSPLLTGFYVDNAPFLPLWDGSPLDVA
jgi:hypothetical protein